MFFKEVWRKLGVRKKFYAAIFEILVILILLIIISPLITKLFFFALGQVLNILFRFFNLIKYKPSREILLFVFTFFEFLSYSLILYFLLKIIYLNFKEAVIPFLIRNTRVLLGLDFNDDVFNYFYGDDEDDL